MSAASFVFTYPLILWAGLIIPIIWIILRAVPPAPRRYFFAPLQLILGLKNKTDTAERTPWWLLLLRSLIIACVLIGLAGPELRSETKTDFGNRMLIIIDATWMHSASYDKQLTELQQLLGHPDWADKQIAILSMTEPTPPSFMTTAQARDRMNVIKPKPYVPNWALAKDSIQNVEITDVLWLSDGLEYQGQRQEFLSVFHSNVKISVWTQDEVNRVASIVGVKNTLAGLTINLQRLDVSNTVVDTLEAWGTDPAGNPALIVQKKIEFTQGVDRISISFDIRAETRARLTHISLQQQKHGGAVFHFADRLKQPDIILLGGQADNEGVDILKPVHFLKQALSPFGRVYITKRETVFDVSPDVIVASDMSFDEKDTDLFDWVHSGGTLVRFAGPKLMIQSNLTDPLLPVKLRLGGRNLGGAMSWQSPRTLAEFDQNSPFYGLLIPDDLEINTQVLAQPSPELSQRVIARLSDQTPLVTRMDIGLGQVIFFHVTANTDWSNLPLSGLFVEMLSRLLRSSFSVQNMENNAEHDWHVKQLIDLKGRLSSFVGTKIVNGAKMFQLAPTSAVPAGIYHADRVMLARNFGPSLQSAQLVNWSSDIRQFLGMESTNTKFGHWFIICAFLLYCVDLFATLWVSGRLFSTNVIYVFVTCLSLGSGAYELHAEPDLVIENLSHDLVKTAQELTLAHVITGNKKLDEMALMGLRGLSDTLFSRTSIEANDPISIDIEKDEITLIPLLYWPVSLEQNILSIQAIEKLNTYLARGGVVLFDTRDSALSYSNTLQSKENASLRRLVSGVNIPPLAPIANDHVLTRSFYLLSDFPGRHKGGLLWAEISNSIPLESGRPFRTINDGVSSVFIGGNDWAAAWAVDRFGQPMFPVGSGRSGQHQREMAMRFGVNLVIHVLTGNYKSDQVHIPALLERLGK